MIESGYGDFRLMGVTVTPVIWTVHLTGLNFSRWCNLIIFPLIINIWKAKIKLYIEIKSIE